jgi:hypothetical protein
LKIPVTPVVDKHAGRFVGRSTAFAMDGFAQRRNDVLGSGHRRAYLEYRRQTICVGIDNLCHALLDAAEARTPM